MSADNTTNISEPEEGWKALLANPYLAGPIKLVLPFIIALAIFAALYLIEPYQQFLVISGLLAAYFVPPAGKESIIPIAIVMGYPWWLVTLAIVLLDVAVSLFVVWNFDLALKIPLIGRLLESGMAAGRNYTDTRPWLRRFSTIGLVFFVFFPLQGTGAMNGAIVGRLLGLEKARVFACVCAGSLASSLIIALGADVILDIYRQDPALGTGILVAIVVAILAAVVGLKLREKRLRERSPR
ncbi:MULTISPECIES: small multi-drug export protein [unclassified Methanoculleus]|uniref:small multi-drug export protein n=1 Tax=unclassified Methanoculleus TaxID=2619537 RepID=UPI0025EBED35|nr:MULTISPECIES: small multi-drug export protein [unclassified Methanoculleus]